MLCLLLACRAEDRLSNRNCNLVDNSVVMSLINQSMNRHAHAYRCLVPQLLFVAVSEQPWELVLFYASACLSQPNTLVCLPNC